MLKGYMNNKNGTVVDYYNFDITNATNSYLFAIKMKWSYNYFT